MIRIETAGSKKVLTLDGKPFPLLAGEVHNSDSSSPAYMEHIWQIAGRLGMNALLLPVAWETVEPMEGTFDFSLPQALILQARDRNMRIVFLWFGSWKNAECMYAPGWVKQDLKRFPRAQIEKGKNKAGRAVSPGFPVRIPYTTLSYLGLETARCDAKAFAAFMRFLKAFDGQEQTVVAVQVENETGLLGAAREVSDAADIAFTWREVFGPAAEEIVAAYHGAGYVETVASAGKAVYDLPLAVNCWLDKGGAPGTYPTGGPVSRVHEVWDVCAPSISVYCPDIYVPQFKAVCDEYTRRGNALFIPESATHSYCAPRLLYTIGHYHAACYSPFGFDDIGKPFTAVQGFLFGMDVSDPALKTPQNLEEYQAVGQLLLNMLPLISEAYGTDRLQALSAETDSVSPGQGSNPLLSRQPCMDFEGFRLTVSFQGPTNPRADGACLCLAVSSTECYVLGNACGLSFESLVHDQPNLDFLQVEEGVFDNGKWIPGRRLNGDETAHLQLDRPGALHVTFFSYA